MSRGAACVRKMVQLEMPARMAQRALVTFLVLCGETSKVCSGKCDLETRVLVVSTARAGEKSCYFRTRHLRTIAISTMSNFAYNADIVKKKAIT